MTLLKLTLRKLAVSFGTGRATEITGCSFIFPAMKRREIHVVAALTAIGAIQCALHVAIMMQSSASHSSSGLSNLRTNYMAPLSTSHALDSRMLLPKLFSCLVSHC
jgi:hypothetical protein